MDFDKFIEKDILEFLDQQAMLVAEKAAGLREEEFDLYEINKDYSKDIDSALKEEDLKKAQKIFEDIKNRYMAAPSNSLSKKRLYIIMEEIFERIKDYETKEEGKKSLFETIRDYEQKGFFKMPELFQGKESDNVGLVLSSIISKEKALEQLTSKKPMSQEDLQKAVQHYRELKELTKRIPATSQKEKEKAYDSALSWYYTLKKIQDTIGTAHEAKDSQKKIEEKKVEDEKLIEQKLNEIRVLKEALVESHSKIARFVMKKDLRNSILEYKRMRNLLDQFPQEMEAEKTALLADALSLYDSIQKLKMDLGAKEDAGLIEQEEIKSEARSREQIKSDINKKIEMIKSLLAQKQGAKAVDEYKKIKELFQSYPEEPIDDKKQLFDKITSAHKDIKLMDTDLKKSISAQDKERISSIDPILKEAHELLDKGKTEEATHRLLEAKHRIQLLPNESFDDKYRLLKDVEVLEHKLLFVKNYSKISTPKAEARK
jgi:hypothetical protein